MHAFGELRIDLSGHRVYHDGVDVHLTRSEFALLAALVSNAGAAMSNREILRTMWGADWQADTTPLQVHVSRLRRKLGESGSSPRHIVTIHGFGYRFEAEPGSGDDAMRIPHAQGDPVAPHTTVTLAFDPEHTLLDIAPRVPVCGWDPEQIIGSFFSPTGQEPWSAQTLILGLVDVGAYDIEGSMMLRWRDGRGVAARGAMHLDVDETGRLLGMMLTLVLPAVPDAPARPHDAEPAIVGGGGDPEAQPRSPRMRPGRE